jgi:hypothetical protein
MNLELTHKLMRPYLCADGREKLSDIFPAEYLSKLWNCATDALQFIMVRVTAENIIASPNHAFPTLTGVIPEYNMNRSLSVDVFQEAYKNIPIIEQEITFKCDSCDGDGRFFHSGHHYKCKSCDQTGKVGIGKMESVKDPSYSITINNVKHNPALIAQMLCVAESLDLTQIEVKYIAAADYPKASIFHLGQDVIVGIIGKPKSFNSDTDDDNDMVNEIEIAI